MTASTSRTEEASVPAQKTEEQLAALVEAAALAIMGTSVNKSQSLVEAGLDSLGKY